MPKINIVWPLADPKRAEKGLKISVYFGGDTVLKSRKPSNK